MIIKLSTQSNEQWERGENEAKKHSLVEGHLGWDNENLFSIDEGCRSVWVKNI